MGEFWLFWGYIELLHNISAVAHFSYAMVYFECVLPFTHFKPYPVVITLLTTLRLRLGILFGQFGMGY